MTDQTGTFQRVGVAEAARRLGVSVSSVRRMIRSGRLESQRVLRPQGSVLLVTLPTDGEDAPPDTPSRPHPSGGAARTNASPAGQLAAWSETFLVPLVAALERSQEIVRDQAETIGALRAELAAARAAHSAVRANLTRYWPGVAVGAVLVAVVVLLAR
jgi:excisionase family DNA binding protein